MGEVGQALFEEAKLALRLGQYREAKTALEEAGRIARKEFGPRHINYASVLQMQAKLEREQGRPLVALPLLQVAIDILRNSPGCPDFILAGVLNNSAFASQSVGLYREAEKQFREAQELAKGSSAPQGQQCYTATLANLAELYNEIGQDERAEPLLREALEVDRRIYTPDHPELGTSMHNLGLYLVRHDRQEEGFRLLNQASKIVEKSLGQQSWQYAQNLSAVARSLREARRYQEAETYCVFALETLRKSRPENSPDIAGMLTDLALVYACRGKFDQAEGALGKAAGIFERTLPHHHQDAIEARFSLFAVLAARQKQDAAFDVLKDVIASESEVMDGILRLGSEKDRLVYVASLQWHVDAALSFAVQNGASNHALIEWAFELILKRRGLAAEALSTQRDVVRGGANAELKDKLDRLNSLKLGIARQMLSLNGNTDLRRRLETSQSEKVNLERELAESIPEIGLQRKLQELGWKRIAAELAEPGALIEFVRYSEWHFAAVAAREEKLKGPERYAVFVLRGGEAPSVRLIDLGEAAAIDKAITDFRACLTGGETRSGNGAATRFSIAGVLAALLPSATRRREKQLTQYGQAVARAVLDPMRPFLAGLKTLVIVPDGHVLWLPFECLSGSDGPWLDQYEITYLATSRDLVTWPAHSPASPAPPVVIAAPDYDVHDHAKSPPLPERQSRALREADWRFAPLPGTQAEGEAIGKILGVQPLMGVAAKASVVKALRSPRILHIATHGFFFEVRKAEPAAGNSVLGSIDQLATLENPMLRSGLALAGANSLLDHKPLPADAEAGIVTAEDVTGLDLHETDLVVLSACDTGLGEIRSGEGAFGFRRAFGLAGARMLVVSLWKVADAETKELMEIFYTLLAKEPPQAALYEAKLQLRKRHKDPFYWAAFICIGRDPVGGKDR